MESCGGATVVAAAGGVVSVAGASIGGDAGSMKTTSGVFLHLRRSDAVEMEDCNSR
jgi:hypothetical protein